MNERDWNELTRRDALFVLGAAAVGAAIGVSPAVVEGAARAAQRAVREAGFEPTFFTPQEWRTVRILADLVIPPDERSGGAVDAGVPEFMDFILTERESLQVRMRGGLRWLDSESVERSGNAFADLPLEGRTAILDDIAWPRNARPELSHGVAFFSFFRDLTASGFFSSRTGVEDLRYMGNRAVPRWDGCPPGVLRNLGVGYDVSGNR